MHSQGSEGNKPQRQECDVLGRFPIGPVVRVHEPKPFWGRFITKIINDFAQNLLINFQVVMYFPHVRFSVQSCNLVGPDI
jgi:hypothetical protein